MTKKTLLAALAIFALMVLPAALPAMAKTPDGKTPAEESVCDGETGAAFGLCNAYCEAMDCDLARDNDPNTQPNASERACLKTWDNYVKITANPTLPCDGDQCPTPGTGDGTGELGCDCQDSLDCVPGLFCQAGMCSSGPSPAV